jgi:hypothetical protein
MSELYRIYCVTDKDFAAYPPMTHEVAKKQLQGMQTSCELVLRRVNEDGTPYEDAREPTYGEKAVGLTFNPSGDPDVIAVKQAFAEAIDKVQAIRAKDTTPSEKGAMLTLAIREAQSAQMWAVKSITWKE